MDKPYVTAAATDISKRWRDEYNYVPASEVPEIKAKHDMFRTYGFDINKAGLCEQASH
jgi:hypothetical protein